MKKNHSQFDAVDVICVTSLKRWKCNLFQYAPICWITIFLSLQINNHPSAPPATTTCFHQILAWKTLLSSEHHGNLTHHHTCILWRTSLWYSCCLPSHMGFTWIASQHRNCKQKDRRWWVQWEHTKKSNKVVLRPSKSKVLTHFKKSTEY